MSKLTTAQQALLQRLSSGAVLILYTPPGAEDRRKFYIETPYSDEDARTCWSVIERGLLKHEGGDMWIIADAGRAALASSKTKAGSQL